MSTAEPEPPGDGAAPGDAGRRDDGAGLDVDAAFAELVARFDAAPPRVGSWPAQEDVDPDEAPAASGPQVDLAQVDRARPPADPAAAPRRGASPEEEGWTPPELPPPARATWWALAWVGVLGGPVFFLVVVIARLQLPGAVLVAAVAAFVAGFLALVTRLPAHHDDDEDGAVL